MVSVDKESSQGTVAMTCLLPEKWGLCWTIPGLGAGIWNLLHSHVWLSLGAHVRLTSWMLICGFSSVAWASAQRGGCSQRLGSLLKDKEKERVPEASLASVTEPPKSQWCFHDILSTDTVTKVHPGSRERNTDPTSKCGCVSVTSWDKCVKWGRNWYGQFWKCSLPQHVSTCTQFRP